MFDALIQKLQDEIDIAQRAMKTAFDVEEKIEIRGEVIGLQRALIMAKSAKKSLEGN